MPALSSTAARRDPAPTNQGPRIAETGIFLGPSPLALWRRPASGTAPVFAVIDDELAETLAVAFRWDILGDFEARAGYLRAAAKALEEGKLTQAHISLAFMNLPKLGDDAVDRLRQLELIRKQGHDVSNEPRLPAGETGGGQWTYGSADRTERNPTEPWRNQPNVSLRNYIALAEQTITDGNKSGGYDAHNKKSGALGRYQLQKSQALLDIEWVNAKGRWTAEAARHGVKSDNDFLNDPDAQELANNLYMRNNERYMTRMNVAVPNSDGTTQTKTVWDLGEEGQTYVDRHGNTIAITSAGLAAAAHREGAPAVHNYVNWLAANNWNVSGMNFLDAKAGPHIAQRIQDSQGLPYQRLYTH